MAMVNVAKKIDKAREKLGIPADEEILGACMANPSGTMGTIGAAAVGGIAGVAIRAKVDKNKAEAAGAGGATTWPGGRNMLAITSKRLVLCKMSAMSGKPTEISAAWDHADIAAFQIEKGKTAYPFSITFADGSIAQGDAAKGSGADQIPEVVASIWG